ncbi:bestrophin family protein [Celeribacter sp. SCSIO 80788]|uniref:bestrophin family protein n=1 Tax=Celeribacter sp. SCSIO 80788 TaxID=3117013 RepID=UPI003DA1F65A
MIVRERPNAFVLFFILKGAVVHRIWPQLLGVGILSGIIVTAHRLEPLFVPGVNPAAFALIGISISIFLSFRNSASYERWWEARQQWGLIIQSSRDIARQSAILDGDAPVASPARRALLEPLIAYAKACVAQLHQEELPYSAPVTPQGQISAPDAILTGLAKQVSQHLHAGRLAPVEAHLLNESLTRLSHAFVACERLANTPLPFAYTLLLHRTAYIFCLMLPFGLADSIGWFTPLAVMLVAYTFFGLDALADELEQPFGQMPNDLPLIAYSVVIERAMLAAMGEKDLPPAAEPHDYILR